MYCPNCKKEYFGKFCPECGVKLVEVPAGNDINFNVGDYAAIMGGVSVSHNESHNTNYDQRVINNIVERQKSVEELRNERYAQFMQLCKRLLTDGLLTEDKKRVLETERLRLCLDEGEAAGLMEAARKTFSSRITMLSRRDSVIISAVNRNVEINNVEALEAQIERLAALYSNYNVEEVSYLYYMLLAALRPKELIRLYETNAVDEYWQTYWVAIAYIKYDNIAKADKAIIRLDRYPRYPEDNLLLLSAVCSYVETILSKYVESAIYEWAEYVKAIVSSQCSPMLLPFLKSVFLDIAPERASEVAIDEEKCKFYIENIVCLDTPEEKEARLKAEEEARRKAEEEARRKAEEEARRRAEEESRRRAEEEARRRAEEEARRRAEEKARRKAEEELRCRIEELNKLELFPLVDRVGKWGCADRSGREVIPCSFNEQLNFNEGLAKVSVNGKVGFIDKSGREVIPCKYDSAKSFSEGLAAVKQGGKWGFVDNIGCIIIPCKYDSAYRFSEGLAVVMSNGKFGFIDKSGQEIIPCKYNEVRAFREGIARVAKLGAVFPYVGCRRFEEVLFYGLIDKNGKEVIPCNVYTRIDSFYDGLAMVEVYGHSTFIDIKSGFIDKSGREVIPCKYDRASRFSEGLALVYLNGKFGFIDKIGREVIPCKYDSADSFSEGLAAVKQGGKWGFVDNIGRIIIPCKYDIAYRFSEGLAGVELNDKMGFIDKSGREVIPCKYDFVKSFSEGRARASLNGKKFYIDKTGKEY